MTKRQSNYLNMVEAVLKHFDNHASIWVKITLITMVLEKLRSIVEAINAAAIKQNQNNPVGHTASKEQIRDMLETILYQTALRVRTYAGIIGDEVLAEKTKFSRSSLDLLGNNDIVIISNILADACTEHLAGLVDYQVDQAMVDKLRELATQTRTLYAYRDTVIDERMEATSRLQQLFTQARKQLKILDDTVEGYIEDDTFVATYFNARRIHDLKGRHTQSKEEKE
jgi:hypothetical protein